MTTSRKTQLIRQHAENSLADGLALPGVEVDHTPTYFKFQRLAQVPAKFRQALG
jgi:hypothetical protein